MMRVVLSTPFVLDRLNRGFHLGLDPNERLGFYRPIWRGELPCIYLVVDNIVAQNPLPLQIARDLPDHAQILRGSQAW
jgi:hypothetical protein